MYLYNNKGLGGSLPPMTASTALESVHVRNCLLTGQIPSAIFKPSLVLFLADGNKFIGSLPTSIGGTRLVQLYLELNPIGGLLPSQLGRLTNLTELHASDCAFSGSIPSQLSRLTNLRSVYLHRNNLSGSVPSLLFSQSLSLLSYLTLSQNHLEGTLPKSIKGMAALQTL